MFVDPDLKVDNRIYSYLSREGFRRSGNHYYRPHCSDCSACISSRIIAPAFEPNKRHKRIVKRNGDVQLRLLDDISNDHCYQLYENYINDRHVDGDMYPPTRSQYDGFLGKLNDSTRYLGFYVNETLLAVSVIDHMDDGVSAIYTFFDPSEEKRSLGTLAILAQIDYVTQVLRLPYVYLGYWVKGCRKMDYKREFEPLEFFYKGRWGSASQHKL